MNVIFKNWGSLFSDGYESVNKVLAQENDMYVNEFKIQFPKHQLYLKRMQHMYFAHQIHKLSLIGT